MVKSALARLIDTHVGVRDAARILGVSRQRVVVLCQRGQLPGAELAYGRWWIPRSAIEARRKSIASYQTGESR
jgi:predicted site-specific integrase-resolvase